MITSSYLAADDLAEIGFARIGRHVQISRKASIYGASGISLGDHVRIDDFCVVGGAGGIVIGDYVHIAAFCGLFGGAGIEMADFSGLSSRVTIYSESDDYSGETLTNPTVPERFRTAMQRGKVTLGRHVIVGAGSTLLPGVTLGEGVAVGAHSLVTRDVAPWKIAAGIPARAVRERKRGLLEQERALREAAPRRDT